MDRSREQIAESIIKFAERNKFHIHPGQDPYTWADLVLVKGGCPCVPGRTSCPCAFATEDIKEFGRCRCGLFADDGYLENYNSLKSQAKSKKGNTVSEPILNNLPTMDNRARIELLKKISINGFSIEDNGSRITLHPRGLEAEASVTIEDDGMNGWAVISATGRYAGFSRGVKRSYFESNINRWVAEAVLQAPG